MDLALWLLNIGGFGLLVAVDEAPERHAGTECVTVINGGLISLPEEAGARLKGGDSTDDVSMPDNPSSISSVGLAS